MLTPHQNPENPWHQGMFHGMSLYTYDKSGSLIDHDDSLEYYGKLNKMMYHVYPVAVHLVTTAGQVIAARNHGYQTNVRWNTPDMINAMRGGNGPGSLLYWPVQVAEVGTQNSPGGAIG